jgi:hypothetical protein
MTGLKCYASDDNSPFAASESEPRPHRSKITALDHDGAAIPPG